MENLKKSPFFHVVDHFSLLSDGDHSVSTAVLATMVPSAIALELVFAHPGL